MQSQVVGRTPSCWAYDAQREPEMLIGVRGGGIWCFSAPHRPICFSPSPPPLSLLERAAARLPPPRRAQQAVRSGRCADLLSVCEPLRLAVCFWLFAGQGAETEGGREIVAGVISR